MESMQVTITGADDGVSVRDLALLSAEFPFVEWGILMSHKRCGEPRYPTGGWIVGAKQAARATGMRLSAHLCGRAARAAMSGERLPTIVCECCFRRVQINGYLAPAGGAFAALTAKTPRIEFILQARSEESIQQVVNDAARIAGASVLFDPSGGRGVEPFRWPVPPFGARVGYAGGIRPENIRNLVGEIAQARGLTASPADAWWIDMESGVRTDDDRFDLARVRAVLEAVASTRKAA